MFITAIDPGNVQSAVVTYDTTNKKAVEAFIMPNADVLPTIGVRIGHALLAVEMVACYGMPVGAEVFETCLWIGRFIEAWSSGTHKPFRKVYRREEKIHLCGTMKAKDGNIRQALMDRYGSTREASIGTKKHPGPLYGFSGDMWAALAVAIVAAETNEG